MTYRWQTDGRPLADRWQIDGRLMADCWQTVGGHPPVIGLPSVCQRYAISLSSLCHRYANGVSSVCHHLAIGLPTVCHKSAISLPSVCQRSVISLTSICQSSPSVCHRSSDCNDRLPRLQGWSTRQRSAISRLPVLNSRVPQPERRLLQKARSRESCVFCLL